MSQCKLAVGYLTCEGQPHKRLLLFAVGEKMCFGDLSNSYKIDILYILVVFVGLVGYRKAL